jgi:hypothetical protein
MSEVDTVKEESIVQEEKAPESGVVSKEEVSFRNKGKVEKSPTALIDNESVVLTKDMTFYHGGQYYQMEKDKKYKVNATVKKTLVDRGVVKPSY